MDTARAMPGCDTTAVAIALPWWGVFTTLEGWSNIVGNGSTAAWIYFAVRCLLKANVDALQIEPVLQSGLQKVLSSECFALILTVPSAISFFSSADWATIAFGALPFIAGVVQVSFDVPKIVRGILRRCGCCLQSDQKIVVNSRTLGEYYLQEGIRNEVKLSLNNALVVLDGAIANNPVHPVPAFVPVPAAFNVGAVNLDIAIARGIAAAVTGGVVGNYVAAVAAINNIANNNQNVVAVTRLFTAISASFNSAVAETAAAGNRFVRFFAKRREWNIRKNLISVGTALQLSLQGGWKGAFDEVRKAQ
jgi:hypothetical protein